MLNAFDKHCQEATLFIKNIAVQLGNPDDTDHAVRVMKCIFRALRRKLIPDESLHIVSQLPLLLKGMYVDGWDIYEPISEAQTFEEFLNDIRNNTEEDGSEDFDDDEQARKKIMAVFNVLKEFISDSELAYIHAEFPKEIAEMV